MKTFEEELAVLRKSVKAWKAARKELDSGPAGLRHYLDTPVMECFGAGDHGAPKLDKYDCIEMERQVKEQAAIVRQIVRAKRSRKIQQEFAIT